MEAKGYCDPRFSTAKTAFESLWKGIEVGAAFSVYWKGQLIVSLWGGYTDRAQQLPWQENTLVNVYSITKGVVATAIAILVDQKRLGLGETVATYWPEFAQGDKQDITVAQLLSHQAGLSGVEDVLQVEDLYDWQAMIQRLEKQKPLWLPGAFSGYHPITWGYLAGELIRKVTNLTPGEFIQQQICQPLDLNLYLGLPKAKFVDCAELIGANHARSQNPHDESNVKQVQKVGVQDITAKANDVMTTETLDKLFQTAQLNPVISPFKHASSAAWRAAQIPASNGHSDAKSLAKLYGTLSSGEQHQEPPDGQRLFSQNALNIVTERAADDRLDLIMGLLIRRSNAGFILSDGRNYGPASHAFGHAGAGGSMAFADPEHEIGFAYVMNQLQPEGYPSRYMPLLQCIYSTLRSL